MNTNYEQFIASNQALIDCYAGVPAEQYSAMTRAEQEGVCQSEASAVHGFLSNGSIEFKSILAERLRAFDAKHD